MKLLLLGPPASGKGTIGKMLSDKLGIPLLSVGAVLRSMPENHPRFQEIHSLLLKGELAPQDFVADLLKVRTNQDDCKNGYILDGWGRAMVDLEYFDPYFDKVILLNISDEVVMHRITGRRMCPADGKIYNINTLPPEELAKCPGELVQREDDKPEVVKRRLEVQKPRSEVLDYFKNQNNIVEVDGEPAPEVVFKKVLEVLDIND